MPTYEYQCKDCGYNFDFVQSMKDDSLTHCEECGHDTLARVLHPVMTFTKGEAKTLGQQADRNTANMGHYELQEKRYQHAEDGRKGREQAGNEPKPKAQCPFWRKNDKINMDLAKIAPKSKVVKDSNGKRRVESEPLGTKAIKYIEEGKV